MSGRAESWARVLTPVAVIGVVAVAIAVGVHSVGDPPPTAGELKRRELAAELASLERDLAQASAALASAVSEQAELQSQLDATRGRPNAEPLPRVNPEGRIPPPVDGRSVRAVIRAVDKANSSYVVSGGAKEGLREGMELHVLRGSDLIGTIMIDMVFPNYASATRAPGCPPFIAQADDACIGVARSVPSKVRLPK